jgi:riboflavin kinase / FMN adenylyltransferase
VISSTEIRKLIATGNVADAAQLMGHPYSLHGPVAHGDKRGRTINVPTATYRVFPRQADPANGIYACRAYLDGGEYQAAINIGINPTFTPEKQSQMWRRTCSISARDLWRGCQTRICCPPAR